MLVVIAVLFLFASFSFCGNCGKLEKGWRPQYGRIGATWEVGVFLRPERLWQLAAESLPNFPFLSPPEDRTTSGVSTRVRARMGLVGVATCQAEEQVDHQEVEETQMEGTRGARDFVLGT